MSKPSTKAKILEALRNACGRELSGETLADSSAVSRVAVWKHIHDCIKAGYPIRATKTGYTYEAIDEDFLFPAEFGELEAMVTHVDETSSTMDIAREKALNGAPEGSIVIAETQTAGRGRNRRTWISQRGSLLFTLTIRPEQQVSSYYTKLRASQYALAETVAELFPEARIHAKWPNDLLVNGKKVGGILAEALFCADTVAWMNIGIGLNVKNPSPSETSQSLSELRSPVPRRSSILKAFLRNFTKYQDDDEALNNLGKRFGLLGKPCTALLPGGGRVRGTLIRVDEIGRAYLNRADNGQLLQLDACETSIAYNMEDIS